MSADAEPVPVPSAGPGEFVEGWVLAQVLGEGAYGEVRLLVHSATGAAVALKSTHGGAGAAREAALHRALRHPHVLRCLGARQHRDAHYMFLEYARGGELFDRIEPDVGMPERAARRYWRQLLLGVGYLHARGVAHRDLKPENLLLDHRDDIKISDFGMATLFRHGARERLLGRICGTVPYAAPEVLHASERPYRATPADLWACAVVLVAMLAGELPWERAHESDARYAEWVAWLAGVAGESGAAGSRPPAGPWHKLSGAALQLVTTALRPAADSRATLDRLMLHPWTEPPDCQSLAHEGDERVWSSQPCGAGEPASGGRGGGGGGGAGAGAGAGGELTADDMEALISYSQPAAADDLLLGSQHDRLTQQEAAQRVAVRMTRVWIRARDEDEALSELVRLLPPRYTAQRANARTMVIECGRDVRMRVWAARVSRECRASPLVLLEFRRARGCGLRFKRCYVQLRDALRPLSAPPPPLDPAAEPMDHT